MHGSLGPRESAPKQHLDRFSRFAELTVVTNTQTDIPRYNVYVNSPHLLV